MRACSLRVRRDPCLASSIGSIVLSSADKVGMSWKNWKTMPMFARRQMARSSCPVRSSRVPFTVTVPAEGRSMPAMRLTMVVLPLPDGPTIATISPSEISRSMPRNARNATRPEWYVFSTPASTTSGACIGITITRAPF